MNFASIDIGSNTVLLLIAKIKDNKLIPIYNKQESPRLGKGLLPGHNISHDKISLLLEILKKYKSICNDHGCTNILITATNAMRIAANGKQIVDEIKDKLNLVVQIIDGATEAKVTYLGAVSSMPNIGEKVVIDIGGGSTELIWGAGNKIKYKHSFQIGVVSLTEKFLTPYPYSKSDINNAINFLKELFNSADQLIPKQLPIIAVSGTPTTLTCMKQGLKVFDEKKVESSILTSFDMDELYEKLVFLKGNDILTKYGEVTIGREDVLFAGLLILKYLRDMLMSDRIIVSGRGVRYGIINDYINNLK